MSKALRKITGVVNKTKTAVIFINQLREKIGVMFGNPEVTPGGRALKYYASVRLDIRKIDNLKEGTEAVGSRTRVRVVKNKVAPPFKSAEFDIMYGKGISKEGSIIDVATDQGILIKSGSWYSYNNDRIGQGRENAKVFLMQNPDIMAKMEQEIKKHLDLDKNKSENVAREEKPQVDMVVLTKEISKISNKKSSNKKQNVSENLSEFDLE
jgi:recombination protein RecA